MIWLTWPAAGGWLAAGAAAAERHPLNHDTSQSWRRGLPHRAALVAAAAGLALLAASCSSSPLPPPSASAYSACMRKHGVTGPFAAPPPTAVPTAASRKAVWIPAKAAAAMQACRPLAPKPKVPGLQVP